jgi:hypothetical protein
VIVNLPVGPPEPVLASCRNCGKQIIRIASGHWHQWYHCPEQPFYGSRGCRAASFEGGAWNEALDPNLLAEPALGSW